MHRGSSIARSHVRYAPGRANRGAVSARKDRVPQTEAPIMACTSRGFVAAVRGRISEHKIF